MGAVCCRQDDVNFNDEVDLTHFALLRSVGKGAFGKVRVVQHRRTRQLYALKYINKAKCIEMRAVENIISERKILEQVTHNLIVNLRYAFQDEENLFMVLDLMLGGDLRFHLHRMGTIPEPYVQFYIAEVALGLRHLHRNYVIHRDIKPDNILLDEHGHAHLTDFNIAVQFDPSKRLTSVAGSMAYMAPEILQKRGYLASVDWWSLGVVCFELLYGKRPFRGKNNDTLQNAILHEPIVFPESDKVSKDAISFIQGLLTRDITQRLGVDDQGFQRLQAHPWLSGMQWHLLENKAVKPPFKPDSKRANFDPTHELEEILLEDRPLIVRRKNPKRSGSNVNSSFRTQSRNSAEEMSPEHQMMEDRFLMFDFTKPEENEWRKKEIEIRHWAQQMSKPNKQDVNGNDYEELKPPKGRRAVAGTYNTSVVDYVNRKPVSPLSTSDILKLEELSRSAKIGTGKAKGTDWRPPSGILSYRTDPASMNAIRARDDYIVQSGGVPPPVKPPPFYAGTQHRRQSSDESCPVPPSPENSERFLMGTGTSSVTSVATQSEVDHLRDQKQRNPSLQSTSSSVYVYDTIARSPPPVAHINTSPIHNSPSVLSAKPVDFFPPPLPPPSSLPPPVPNTLPRWHPVPRTTSHHHL